MILIANRFEIKEEETINSLDNINNVELFYKVYNKLDYLTSKELKVLRNFCYALYNPYDLTIVREHNIETEDDIYDKYRSILDDCIEEKTKRKIISKL